MQKGGLVIFLLLFGCVCSGELEILCTSVLLCTRLKREEMSSTLICQEVKHDTVSDGKGNFESVV